MVNKQDDGGPAFPVPEVWAGEQPIREGWGGMTLRDYFAAHAIAGILSNASTQVAAVLAKDAYLIADEMLKARSA